MRDMRTTGAGADPLARRLRALRCACGAPAATIHIIDPDAVGHGPWPRGTRPRDTVPAGRGSFAAAACARHSYFGVAIRVDWLAARLRPWLLHTDLGAIRAPHAVLALLTRQEERAAAGGRPRPALARAAR